MAEPLDIGGSFGTLTSEVSVGPSDTSEITILEKVCKSGLLDPVGTIFCCDFMADYTTDASPPVIQFKLYYGGTGGTVVIGTGASFTPPVSITNGLFDGVMRVTTRSSGSVYGWYRGLWIDTTSSPIVPFPHRTVAGVTSPTTTGEVTVTLTAAWNASDAGSDLDMQYCHFYVMGEQP